MINLWDYEYGGRVKIVDIEGNIFSGEALEVTDLEERSEDEKKEDGITIQSDGALIEFYQSEIETIEFC